MHRPSIRHALVLFAALGGCDEGVASAPPEPEPTPTPAPREVAQVTAPAPAAPVAPTIAAPVASATLEAWLHDASVTDDDYARRTFYSWTSTTTAARLREDRELFDDAQLPEGPTAYVQWAEHVAARDDVAGKIAKLLLGHPDLARRRYAWVRPWATRMGMVRPYGDQLIAVTLRPDAIVGRFDPSREQPWEFRDLDDRVIPLGRVLADPSRIGVILHIRREAQPHFREYVLCNASAIERWSLATEEIAAVIRADAHVLRELAPIAAELDAYADTRAFGVDHYDPDDTSLVAIADALDASKQIGKPFATTPKRRFRSDAAPKLVQVREVPPRFVTVA